MLATWQVKQVGQTQTCLNTVIVFPCRAAAVAVTAAARCAADAVVFFFFFGSDQLQWPGPRNRELTP